jgi:hypothetical protein
MNMKKSMVAALVAMGLSQMAVEDAFAHAATYSYRGGVAGNSTSNQPTYTATGLSVAEVKLDFAAIAAARSAASQAALASADILEVIGVKAGVIVLLVKADVVTAEGAAATCGIGDGAAATGYLSALDLNVAAQSASLATTSYSVAVGGGKLYTADDTIDVTLNSNSIDVAVLNLLAVMVDTRKTK